jgi:hypothetical protein
MAFIAMSQNLTLGGSEEGAVVGPGGVYGLMTLFVGRVIAIGWLARELWRALM